MPRQIRLIFVETGESVTAAVLDQEAPGVCSQVGGLLPIEGTAIHGMYSGSEIFLLLDNPQPAPLENQVQLPLPGEILYFYDPGVSAAGSQRATAEICIVYGRGVVLRGPEGTPTQASLFARIAGDWKHDWTGFAQACQRVRWEGPKRLRIESG